MADIQAADATGKIEIPIPVNIFDPGSFRLRRKYRRDQLRPPWNRGFAAREQCARFGSWNCRPNLYCFHGYLFLFKIGRSLNS